MRDAEDVVPYIVDKGDRFTGRRGADPYRVWCRRTTTTHHFHKTSEFGANDLDRPNSRT